ncbi:hypothetical protein EXU85_21960 [Spirosoma sp. KCTC 42546]|uniref:hypothetical protein n=1 Tax=Spirosoma sp. KCTC 42546 TaxID=2520506 RepID=UPI00115A2DDA|nr:hypothetical protein [Spirosoma sp. KCTC 42546]QDK81134.1 hypothetical protein EXU85_21960 [Spirosoma sp. KCTC 42546]
MQIIENWTRVRGIIKTFSAESDTDNFGEMALSIQQTSSLEGIADLISPKALTKARIYVPTADLADTTITPGQAVELILHITASGRLYAQPGSLHVLNE